MTTNLPLDRWRYFVEIGVWPKRANFDPIGWMENFQQLEWPLALRLLEGFTFYSDELTQQMFRSAFLNHSQNIVRHRASYISAREEWTRYINSVIVVRVTGETPSDADSGYRFARHARDVLGIAEHQIMSPEQAILFFVRRPEGHILFVDDFVGSGNQFVDTWRRPYAVDSYSYSFQSLARGSRGKIAFAYCPVLCTDLGRRTIKLECPEVEIVPAHFLDARQGALAAESFIWREDMESEGPEFVRAASARAEIPDLDGKEGCWRGFHKLGLAVAFEHAWPDATLPLFYHHSPKWKPLLRKGAL